jgi:hypothetical protein
MKYIFVKRDRKGKFARKGGIWQSFKTLMNRIFWGTATVILVGLILMTGSFINPQVQVKTVEAVKQVEMDYPVLDRIAKAESYNSQFCTKEIVKKAGCKSWEVGSVLIHINGNGTYDIGKFAVNSTHLSEAVALGYNVYQENDNFEFAKYLFRNQGSSPWDASRSKWNK